MLRHLVVIENVGLLIRVRRLLTNNYGASVSDFASNLGEAPGVLAKHNSETHFVIADIPKGKTPKQHLDDLELLVHGNARVVLIFNNQEGVSLSDGNGCTLIPDNAIGKCLTRALRIS